MGSPILREGISVKTRLLVAIVFMLVFMLAATSCVYVTLEPTATPVSTTETPSPINTGFNPPPTSDNQVLPAIPDFVSAIAAVRPSVVAINTRAPGLDIFGSTFNQEGAGSGWIIDANGLIVTNNHVVEGANTITVTLEDGRNFPAELVRTGCSI